SPTIPFYLLPSSIAFESQITTYILAGVSGIIVWDVLSNITADYYMFALAKNRYALPVYIISRYGCFSCFTLTRFLAYPVSNCKLVYLVDSFYPIATAGSCFLFFLRARAVYITHNYIVAFFALLWVSLLATCLTVPFSTIVANIGDTPYCVVIFFKDFATSSIITATVYDTAIFLAISYKLMSHSLTQDHGLRARILGRNLPAFSRGMLRNGQKYYLVTILSNLTTIILAYAPINPIYRPVPTVPNVMLTNIMACYVFRKTILG
ncbi:hypothetical protein GYMLUDRAFT_138129, partial [Collybiopsis luxurians FD-317 M1]